MMQDLRYTLGNWQANARVQQIGSGKLMAIISVSDRQEDAKVQSRHTAVVEHEEGQDSVEVTRRLVQRLIGARFGN
jgi:hypothetical protein